MTEDNHFKVFARGLERAIAAYEEIPAEDLLRHQRQQLDALVALEDEFRTTLYRHPWGPAVYRDFVTFICDRRRNILAARPYFRERQQVFTGPITEALKTRNPEGLRSFRINYAFVAWVLAARRWNPGSRLRRLAASIEALRTEIVTMNMPLAISQARIFWSRTPRSHLSYMDLIQIHAGGLAVAVDKFVPPVVEGMSEAEVMDRYRKFRAVAIGRMIGDRISAYSETLVHFFPRDSRKIYRANKLLSRQAGLADFDAVSEGVNSGVDPQHQTTPAEIADLVASASTVSLDAALAQDEGQDPLVERYPAPSQGQPDARLEAAEEGQVLRQAIEALPLLQQKLLRMRGLAW